MVRTPRPLTVARGGERPGAGLGASGEAAARRRRGCMWSSGLASAGGPEGSKRKLEITNLDHLDHAYVVVLAR